MSSSNRASGWICSGGNPTWRATMLRTRMAVSRLVPLGSLAIIHHRSKPETSRKAAFVHTVKPTMRLRAQSTLIQLLVSNQSYEFVLAQSGKFQWEHHILMEFMDFGVLCTD